MEASEGCARNRISVLHASHPEHTQHITTHVTDSTSHVMQNHRSVPHIRLQNCVRAYDQLLGVASAGRAIRRPGARERSDHTAKSRNLIFHPRCIIRGRYAVSRGPLSCSTPHPHAFERGICMSLFSIFKHGFRSTAATRPSERGICIEFLMLTLTHRKSGLAIRSDHAMPARFVHHRSSRFAHMSMQHCPRYPSAYSKMAHG